MWKAMWGQRSFGAVAQITDYSASAQLLKPWLCTADAGNGEDGQPQKSKIKTPFETQNCESWASQVIPFSRTRWLTLDEYGTPEQLWLKVKMRPDGIYVTESEGGRCSVTLAWSNKGRGEKKMRDTRWGPVVLSRWQSCGSSLRSTSAPGV